MIRPWFRQAAVPWKTTATQTRASGENRVSTKPGVLQTAPDPVMPAGAAGLVAAAVSAIAGAAAAVAQRWPLLGEVPVWAAASAASGGLLLAPGWPAAGGNTT